MIATHRAPATERRLRPTAALMRALRAETSALLKLAQPADLAALRDAEKAVTNETTKGALGRLIKKLEGVK